MINLHSRGIDMNKHWRKAAICLAVVVLTACSEAPKTTSETKTDTDAQAKAGPPEPVSGKTAYWEIYTSARNWARDAQPLRVESKDVPGVQNKDGKAGMWTATLVSPSQKEARVFTYSVIKYPPDVYKGVTIGRPLPWNGPSAGIVPFQMSNVNTDSDSAYKTASGEAESWLKTHPGKDASLTLTDSVRYHIPTWVVVWGDSKSGYRALISGIDGASITKQ